MGSPTLFPAGPYIIASVFKAPVIGVFCRLTPTGYEVHMEALAFAVDVPRRQRQLTLDALAADYVCRLEAHVRASPYGWFNFYDFWGS
jgi:predicted LPLAT superfamily acyltransferase